MFALFIIVGAEILEDYFVIKRFNERDAKRKIYFDYDDMIKTYYVEEEYFPATHKPVYTRPKLLKFLKTTLLIYFL